MLEMINGYIKYVYYGIGIIIFILLIILLVKIAKVNKSLYGDLQSIKNIEDKLKAIQEKTDYLQESFSTSWAFFIEIAAIIQIVKVVLRDYSGTPKAKRSMIKSTARSVIKNPKVITKIKKLV